MTPPNRPSPSAPSASPAAASTGPGRRSVLWGAAAVGSAAPLASFLSAPAASAASAAGRPAQPSGPSEVPLHWLEGRPAELAGSSWGTPWPMGAVPGDQSFALAAADGSPVPVQSWPLALWPDGSLKWSGHTISGAQGPSDGYTLTAGRPAAPRSPVTVRERRGHVDVGTGVITARIPTGGTDLVTRVMRGDRVVAKNGRLVTIRQDGIPDDGLGTVRREELLSDIEEVAVEQSGPVRAVVRITGRHRRRGRAWLPFTVRLYFFAGAESFRMVHSFVFDTDGRRDAVAGLGVRFTVPLDDEPHDRHVRLVGEGHGAMAEAVRPVTGLRRDPGAAVRRAQVAGERTPDVSTWDTRVSSRLDLIPAFGDYKLSQLSSEGFTVHKRTGPGHGWIPVDQGRRAGGTGYVGGPSGGFAFGLKDFWQLHPTQLDIRNAHTREAEVTVWLWSPDAPAMDTRFYHDGMGQDTYEEQLEGLEITYEDYEPGFGTPYGIARTSELTFWALDGTPGPERLGAVADAVRAAPQLVNPVDHLVETGAFGGLFGPVDRSTPQRARIEDNLDFLFDYYVTSQAQRHWYGFWDYGDVMHSQDADRKVWRYDIGGYAWANSELSPDLWLWYAFLRTGRADIFRFAEAMTRHTGEVDVYHAGDWAGLGTRHGVQHWADSAKQQRISTATYRRFYHYLTTDERTGDLMRELARSEETFLVLDPIRKIREEPYEPDPRALAIGFGTDWSGLAAAWLTEWERRGPLWEECRDKLLGTMETIAAQPNGFFQGSGRYDMETGRFEVQEEPVVTTSHLAAVFGLVEINAELLQQIDMPEFEAAWLQYCRLWNGTDAEAEEELGGRLSPNRNLRQAHTRLAAYAAVRLDDDTQAERAWSGFLDPRADWEYDRDTELRLERVEHTLNPTDWCDNVSTNNSAQYGLAAIQILALIGDRMPR
ncbi:exo-rhamnogalacturonan lyase family protein [Streptomyces marincola]|uniref:exo-rhamnogalacturonan lyase family protein n=1 Tax=Streptomyces marincola TaxID=2878388 RepID=UPI001CF4BE89|nr:Tat pathway signal sequence domain protein [Streptomyces marincola]UCM90291.1 Tat pathway signal sequence domain protein [Streptomyces marincola]